MSCMSIRALAAQQGCKHVVYVVVQMHFAGKSEVRSSLV